MVRIHVLRQTRMLLLVLTIFIHSVNSTGIGGKGNTTRAYLLEKISAGSRPLHTTDEIDCMWRRLAMDYSISLQPFLNETQHKLIHDALELKNLCGDAYVPSVSYRDAVVTKKLNLEGPTFFVDPVAGNDDTNDGTSEESPLRTIVTALLKTRSISSPIRTIVLKGGEHRLNETLSINADDSGLRITSAPGERAVVSGGQLLENLQWTLDDKDKNIYKTSIPKGSIAEIPAMHYRGQRATLARYPNANPELDLFPSGYITDDTSWSSPKYRGKVCDPNMQCGKSTNITVPAPDAYHGMYQNYSVGQGGACDRYEPNYSPWCSGEFYLLRQFPEMHTRSPSGIDDAVEKLPNSPYKGDPQGWVVHAWRPGHWYTWMWRVNGTTPATHVRMWHVYESLNAVFGKVPAPKTSTDDIKYLGVFDDHEACWSACNASSTADAPCEGWAFHEPTFDPSYARQCYKLTTKAWSAQAEVNVTSGRGPHQAGGAFEFGEGGTQGGEGNEAGGEWFVEGPLEELDAPNEFHFDRESQDLRFIPNETDVSLGDVVVPKLAILIKIAGSQESPVRNVVISNITFTETRPTFLDPRTNPSGGDWSLERSGALYLEGCENVSIFGNTFKRLDSNAVSINGYTRYVTIDANEFVWLGQNAITSWGRTKYNDGTDGNFPRYTTVSNNFVREIGHIQKQSSFYFQATTAEARIHGNIVFNIPRAAINFNDGFGGGANVSHNLLFNTCRESSDHGAFNSWDRLPYVTTVRDGTPSTVPAVNDVHHNFVVANYAADGGCLDNDDGSSYYDIRDNFCMFGGHKQNFDGHSKRGFRNIYVHPQVYGTKCVDEETEGESTGTSGPNGLPPAGYAEAYFQNICILPNAGDPYLSVGGDLHDRSDFEKGLVLGNNSIFAPNGDVSVTVSGTTVTFSKFQELGFDPTSSVSGDVPTTGDIASWAREKLGF